MCKKLELKVCFQIICFNYNTRGFHGSRFCSNHLEPDMSSRALGTTMPENINHSIKTEPFRFQFNHLGTALQRSTAIKKTLQGHLSCPQGHHSNSKPYKLCQILVFTIKASVNQSYALQKS